MSRPIIPHEYEPVIVWALATLQAKIFDQLAQALVGQFMAFSLAVNPPLPAVSCDTTIRLLEYAEEVAGAGKAPSQLPAVLQYLHDEAEYWRVVYERRDKEKFAWMN
jgi:hypothetical protein